MKRPSVDELLAQLEELQAWCEGYVERNPRNWGEYAGLTPYYKPLRDGIVFYSSGWGYRLRKNWQQAIFQKRLELLAEKSGVSMTEPTTSASNTGLQADVCQCAPKNDPAGAPEVTDGWICTVCGKRR